MEKVEKVAVFDFCETLIKFQTADAFINYVYEKTHSRRMLKIEKAKQLFYKLRIPQLLNLLGGVWEKRSLNKKWRLYELSGFDKEELEKLARQFYVERIRQNLIEPVIIELQKKKKEGYCLGIVSGGFDIYIKYFATEFGVDFYLASQIGFKRNVCTGHLIDKDCMREQKVIAIKTLFDTAPKNSVSYSDSLSDLPILLWASRGIVVSKDKHQGWIDNYHFDEIIWQQ